MSQGAHAALEEEKRHFCTAVKDIDVNRMSREVEKAEAQLDGLKVPPGVAAAKPPEALAPDVDKAGAATWVKGARGERTMLVRT